MSRKSALIVLVVLAMVLAACGAKTTPTPTLAPAPTRAEVPTETKVPFLEVGEVTSAIRTLEDADASLRAYEKRAVSGDNFLTNLYERPFTSETMEYLPDVNILTVAMASDVNFFYFTIQLDAVDPTIGKLTGTYGIEFDRTKTGRGDMLVMANDLSEEWSVENVKVYADKNSDLGGYKPMEAEKGLNYQGYESTVKMDADKVAYARLVPGEPTQVQIAVSQNLLDNPKEFLWGGWADRGINNPLLFDYNDHFGMSEAGSPIKTSSDYPLAALYSVDNTCRLPFGLILETNIPGMCLSFSPKPEGSTSTCVCPPCSGFVAACPPCPC